MGSFDFFKKMQGYHESGKECLIFYYVDIEEFYCNWGMIGAIA